MPSPPIPEMRLLSIFRAPMVDSSSKGRRLLSAAPAGVPTASFNLMPYQGPYSSQPIVGATGPAAFAPIVGVYTPTQLQTAYGVNLLGAANQGQGVTIAIVDVFDDSTAIADVNAYSAQYGLPQLDGVGSDPTFQVIKNGTVLLLRPRITPTKTRAGRPASTWTWPTRWRRRPT